VTDFGVLLFPNVRWDILLDRCEQAEELGFRSVWIDDHGANPAGPRTNWMEVWTTLAALATCTRRVLLGPLVSNVILRHPVMLARQATGIDNISGGRLQIGMGAGYALTDFEMVGLQPWSPHERGERFGEAVELVDRLLRGETVDYKGKHYQVPKMRIRPRPVHIPRPPLCIAAHARQSLKVVARHGDIWSSFGGWGLTSPELIAVTKARAEALDEFCAELGRDPASVRRQILAGNPATTPDPIWSSVDAFDTWLAGWEEIGIDEIVLYFPPEVLYEPEMIDPEVLDHIQGLLFTKRAA
jgi:alkanesulfonate monooxygenase SsuD/methylene tetrahydromethanopterin reductase-like flavin-dependent oxidoreductase (luciferase family)